MSESRVVSCLKQTSDNIHLDVEAIELTEHSDDEWYPPTPPLYDVTDRLRELNSRDDGVSSEHVQSSITWRPDIVQVKFIQDDEQPSPVGLRLNRQSSSVNLYVKDSFQMTAEPPPSSLSLIERICAIDELGYDEDCQEDTDQSVAVDVKTEFFPQSNQFKLKPAISDLTIISPVMEEITKEGDDESDTTSEISEIPDDEVEEKSNCDSGPKNVPCEESESNGNDSDDEYSQDEEEYSENSSSEESYNSSFPESESASCSKVTRDDRHDSRAKQECSPLDVSLGQELRLTPNEDIKTTEWRSGNEANFDKVDTNQSEDSVGSPDQRLTNHSAANSRDIREEIKVEFERQHGKYFQHHHHRDIAKKSPEDSGFESYQQSSVEQNSNQNSDDDDVIATFSTVMEAENETSTVNEEHFVSNSEVYTTNKLFVEAEEARVRSRRLREESIKQLGLNFSVAPTLTTKNCDKLSPKPKTRESCGNQSTTKVLSECSKVGPKYLQQSISSTKTVTSVKSLKCQKSDTNVFKVKRSLSSKPLDLKALSKELNLSGGKNVKSAKNDADESDDERRPTVIKAVNIWKARKKEEEKLKRRYNLLCNKYNRRT